MGEVFIAGLQLSIIGILVVFVALTLVAVVVSNLKYADRFFSARPGHHHQPAAQAAPAAGETATPTDAIPPEVIVAIAAAVAEALGEGTRIRHIRRRQAGTTWQMQGRATIMGSHQVRK
ncbi:MAG: hypothetical protein Kow0031_07330 [Anaerolineae bacterium]